MQTKNDEWGRDPAVRRMRQVFSRLEQAHNLLLQQLQVSWLDTRLADVRETARALFERTVSLTRAQGREIDAGAMIEFYLDALIQAIGRSSIPIPQDLQIDHKKIIDEVISCSG